MTLKHKSGYSEKYELSLPLDTTGGKSNIQAMGSRLSYGRRYTLRMAFNIVVQGEDDDGDGGYIAEDQVIGLRKLIEAVQAKDAKRDEAALCRFLKVDAREEIPHFKPRQALSVLEEASQKLGVSLEG